jgi:hypothetical protein
MKRFGQLGEDGGFQGLGDNIGWSFLIEAQTRGLSPDPSTLLTQARVWNWPHGLATQGCQCSTRGCNPKDISRRIRQVCKDIIIGPFSVQGYLYLHFSSLEYVLTEQNVIAGVLITLL